MYAGLVILRYFMNTTTEPAPLSGYQKFIIFLLAITQFSVVLDFMVMSPLGDMLMKSMALTPARFGKAVAAYAISAGISGLLVAGFADKYDRKKLLVFFYSGFVMGTVCCALATNYWQLIGARIFTGVFGGVIGSVSMAIVTDLFTPGQRGRVMSIVQMGFAASQVLGIPISLKIAEWWGWPAPFFMVAAMGIIILMLILARLQPVVAHLAAQKDSNALQHLWHNLSTPRYLNAFVVTCMLSVGGFMMMPFGSAFAINNLKITHTTPAATAIGLGGGLRERGLGRGGLGALANELPDLSRVRGGGSLDLLLDRGGRYPHPGRCFRKVVHRLLIAVGAGVGVLRSVATHHRRGDRCAQGGKLRVRARHTIVCDLIDASNRRSECHVSLLLAAFARLDSR